MRSRDWIVHFHFRHAFIGGRSTLDGQRLRIGANQEGSGPGWRHPSPGPISARLSNPPLFTPLASRNWPERRAAAANSRNRPPPLKTIPGNAPFSSMAEILPGFSAFKHSNIQTFKLMTRNCNEFNQPDTINDGMGEKQKKKQAGSIPDSGRMAAEARISLLTRRMSSADWAQRRSKYQIKNWSMKEKKKRQQRPKRHRNNTHTNNPAGIVPYFGCCCCYFLDCWWLRNNPLP